MKTFSSVRRILGAVAVFCLLVPAAQAQDDDGGPISQGDDAKYLEITYVKFKAGKRERAMQIIAEHFKPAGEKAGTPSPVMAIHFQSGKWDAAYIWEMAGGMADMEWYRSPNDVKWWAALVEMSGGEEEAGALMAEYLGSIAGSMSEVGHHHVPAD